MNAKEQVIELAKQAGFDQPIPFAKGSRMEQKIMRFATLVRNAALDEAAHQCMKQDGVHDAIYADAIESLKEPTP